LDSLLQRLPTAKADTSAVLLYLDVGKQYRNAGDLNASAVYYLKAQALSRELNYMFGLFESSDYYSFVLKRQALYDSAIAVNRETMEVALRQADAYQVAVEKHNIGVAYVNKGFNETALTYYMESLAYFEQANHPEEMGLLHNMIQVAYARMDRHEDAVPHGEKVLTLLPDTLGAGYGYALLNLSISYCQLRPPQEEKAMAGLQKVLHIAALTGNADLEAEAYNMIANIHFRNNRIDESETYYRKALAFFREEVYPKDFCIANIGLAKIAMFRNDFGKAGAMAQKNLEISRSKGIRLEEKNVLSFLWELSAARHDYAGRNRWKAALDSVQHIVVNETMLRAVEELQIKYETEKKEIQIIDLEKENRWMVGLSLAGGAALLLALGLLFYRHRLNVNKRRLAEQQVKQLQQEQQLIATQAVLDGETQERTRLARDLHDGLGGLLSAVRLNLEDMKGGAARNADGTARFDKAIGMLDESIREMRRVAHHLMPDALSRFGLKTALTDFCNSIPSAEFNYFGDGRRFDRNLEVVIYRIVHELINNSLKHARAGHILVQIVQETGRIALTVQDDGHGFDPETVTTGAGIRNIRTRVASSGGTIDMRSSAENGTEINVELEIRN
jgi:signal transduction histidine kinase